MDALQKKISDAFRGSVNDAIESIEKTHAELYDSAKKLKEEKDKLRHIMKGGAKGVIVVDNSGNVLYVNENAEKVLGADARDKIGKNINEGLSEEYLLTLSRTITHRASGRKLDVLEVTGTDDTRDAIASSSAVVQDQNGRPVGMISVLRDIQKQKELRKMQADFVDNVTHELRTPLVAVKHTVDLILENTAGELNEQQRKLLEITQRNIKRLQRLIDDMLDFSKLSSDSVLLDLRKQRIDDLFQECAASLQPWAASKSIAIEVRPAEDLPEIAYDREKITQVIVNLLSNAIKFTPDGGRITLEGRVRGEQGQDRSLLVSVADTGKGIAREDYERIFEKFVQVGTNSPMEIRGTGLGLSIVKKIIELHRGTIRVESELGRGSTFFFTLPLE
jgi:two-component system phosphate regulon sensor histidine kinase PhoR